MKILAIETSCDETAIAIVEFSGRKEKPTIKILTNLVSSQVKLHAKYGGVVPNIAKREHQKNLVPLLLQGMKEARIPSSKNGRKNEELQTGIEAILEREPELCGQILKKILPLKAPDIDAIAVTHGPGLAPALWVGINFAKSLAYTWNKPLIPVNHMEGHLYSAFLQNTGTKNNRLPITIPQFPALALLVSGGHTELVVMHGHGKYKIIGETLDDAAGEAFDKVARILGLGYPGGPEISRLAEKFPVSGNKLPVIKLPRPMLNSSDYNFSFSGLKTAALYLWQKIPRTPKTKIPVAKEFQNAVVEVLTEKTIRAAKEYKAKSILLGGGVAANQLLRITLAEKIKKERQKIDYRLPAANLTGDNALMISLAAFFAGKKKAPAKVGAEPNLKLS